MVEPINTDPQIRGAEKQLTQLKVYSPPRVEELGDLRSLTLGTSIIGVGESDSAGTWYAIGMPNEGF